MDYKDTLQYLFSLERFGMVFGLENITRLAQVLGNPQERLATVHIAGTNGKGSVGCLVSSVVQRAGYRVGLYTSPHLISFTERITVNGVPITWDEVVQITDLMRERIREHEIPETYTFFDFTTAMALHCFSRQRVDLSVMEVGLGGRLDSTNIIRPLVTVITNVSLEHTQVLGNTLEAIAWEKAGVVKDGVPVVSGVTQPEITALIAQICDDRGAPCYSLGKDFHCQEKEPGRCTFRGRRWHMEALTLGLAGRFQITNAALSLAALEVLEEGGYCFDRDAVYRGLAEARWPGRLEIIPGTPTLVLDGAHNPAAAAALREVLEKEFDYPYVSLMIGIMEDKDADAILRELVPLVNDVVVVQPRMTRAKPAEALAAVARRYARGRVAVIPASDEALAYVRAHTPENGLVVVTGSLFTVGEVRAQLKGGIEE